MMSYSSALAEQKSILTDLAAVGIETPSLSELRSSGMRYRQAIPVLLRWLPMASDLGVEEEVVRALSVPWAKPAATAPLIEEFRKADRLAEPAAHSLLWAIGNALEVVYDDAHFDEIVELAWDRRYGTARQMMILGLGKSKRPEAVDVLLGLVEDPDVDGHAVSALGKLKAPAARTALERKLDDPRAWVRGEARRALAKLPQ